MENNRDDIEVTAGKTWMRKTKDREEWRRLSEGYVLQWTDNAYNNKQTAVRYFYVDIASLGLGY